MLVSVVIVSKDRKKDLIECLDSYLKSSYKRIEIIVVDNASNPPLLLWLPKKYPSVKLITSDTNLGAAEGRNKGLDYSEGEYIVFTDDDAKADKDMIRFLIEAFQKEKNAGIIQPLVYDKQKKNMLQGAGHDIDLTTGRIRAWGVKEIDKGQYDGLREVPMCGCVWMVKREVFDKIGNYDADYFIPYEDSDFSLRTRKAGFKLFCYSIAKTWHQGVKKTYVHPWVEWLGITSKERAYRIARNKMMFMLKNSPFPNKLVFFFIILPNFVLMHFLIISFSGRFDILGNYLNGVVSGLWYCLTYPIRKPFLSLYQSLDNISYPLKMLLIAWSDPLPKVIDTSGESILDLACGQGKPMELIKYKMKVKYSVGVDLFEPYLKEARAKKIHTKYILGDIRKVKFPPRSFDIVIASHVLEHLTKNEAWKVLSNMEKIAKKQVIMVAPIGMHYHPASDGNIYQIHKSAFIPKDLEERGYNIRRYGWKWLLGHNRLVDRVGNDLLRKILYTFNILMTPVYYLNQSSCDYIFVAYKNISK